MPVAIDTNVLVRFITRDNDVQAKRALRLFERSIVYVTTTVLMETEWVLRKTYRYDVEQIAQAFEIIMGNSGLILDEPSRVAAALKGFRAGVDFADALHVAGCHDSEAFATFDDALRKRAPRFFKTPQMVSP
jgi:predicted nucleic-acid-binding protein